MFTSSERIFRKHSPGSAGERVHNIQATRSIERVAQESLAPAMLMQRAGTAIARLALAIAPHADTIWIPCGPGNNGGDGYAAAAELLRLGKHPIVTQLDFTKQPSDDFQLCRQQALQAGLEVSNTIPASFDLCIDAMYGIGKSSDFDSMCLAWVSAINASNAVVLAVDVPTGLNADTGQASDTTVMAHHTMSLLTLKPGLFTADARDHCGDVWLNDLGVDISSTTSSQLGLLELPTLRRQNSHKGSYGDVAVIGGDNGMLGASILCARAALHGGAGRVYVTLLAANPPAHDFYQPELMFRPLQDLDLGAMVTVAGCGAGTAIDDCINNILLRAKALVLDADALNVLAAKPETQNMLAGRPARSTVLTPHPLEAARLLGTTVQQVQANRIAAAQAMADRWNCIVVLKGSGTIIAAKGALPTINTTGGPRLATAGTGDVLAGLIASYMAFDADIAAAARRAVYNHGAAADQWPDSAPSLTASGLASALRSA